MRRLLNKIINILSLVNLFLIFSIVKTNYNSIRLQISQT